MGKNKKRRIAAVVLTLTIAVLVAASYSENKIMLSNPSSENQFTEASANETKEKPEKNTGKLEADTEVTKDSEGTVTEEITSADMTAEVSADTTDAVENDNKDSQTNSGNNSSSSDSSGTDSSGTSSGNSGGSGENQVPAQNTTESSSADSTQGKTWHEAVYETIYHPAEVETIEHPAETEQRWVVDQEAYSYEEPVYEMQCRCICNDCGADITDMSDDGRINHAAEHLEAGGKGSWSDKYVNVQVGTKTVFVPEEGHYETVVIKEAWTETIVVKEAWVEKILVKEAGWY